MSDTNGFIDLAAGGTTGARVNAQSLDMSNAFNLNQARQTRLTPSPPPRPI